MTARIDISRKKYGRWTVVGFSHGLKWNCLCDCGTSRAVNGSSLRMGRSLGCNKCHSSRDNRRTHGEKHTRLYNIWCKMKSRCHKENNHAFSRYGGRGIAVCAEWLQSFELFRDWARANGYEQHLTIDRKDNDKGYSPENCRWATYAEQNRNYSRNRPIDFNGRSILIGDLASEYGMPGDVVKNRIRRYGWTILKALQTPVRDRGQRSPWVEAGMSRSSWYRKRAAISFERVATLPNPIATTEAGR